jgi:hypothetical protein
MILEEILFASIFVALGISSSEPASGIANCLQKFDIGSTAQCASERTRRVMCRVCLCLVVGADKLVSSRHTGAVYPCTLNTSRRRREASQPLSSLLLVGSESYAY